MQPTLPGLEGSGGDFEGPFDLERALFEGNCALDSGGSLGLENNLPNIFDIWPPKFLCLPHQ